jgi:hypothetical protein
LLYPEFDESLLDDSQEEVAEYKGSYYFDFEKGDFALAGNGKVKKSNGTEAWEQRCIKALLTPKGSCFAYLNHGSVILDAINTSDRKEAESNIRRSIKETLMSDKLTERVDDITFDWFAPDGAEVSCKVVGVDGQTGHINVKLGGEYAWQN